MEIWLEGLLRDCLDRQFFLVRSTDIKAETCNRAQSKRLFLPH